MKAGSVMKAGLSLFLLTFWRVFHLFTLCNLELLEAIVGSLLGYIFHDIRCIEFILYMVHLGE